MEVGLKTMGQSEERRKIYLKRLLHEKARSYHQQNFMPVFVDIYDIPI